MKTGKDDSATCFYCRKHRPVEQLSPWYDGDQYNLLCLDCGRAEKHILEEE